MKSIKLLPIFFIIFLALASCTQENSPGSIETPSDIATGSTDISGATDSTDPNEALRTSGMNLVGEIVRDSTQTVEASHPEVAQAKAQYDTEIAKISNILGVDAQGAAKILQKYEATLVPYKALVMATGTTPNATTIAEYEVVLIRNLANDGITTDAASLRELVSTVDFAVIDRQLAIISDYMLPNGAIVDPVIKQGFEEYKAENGGFYTDDAGAMNGFMENVYISELEANKQCDQIPDPIRRDQCRVTWGMGE